MIIIGYPGIGKSTVARNHDNIIDLESSCFWKYEEDVTLNKTGAKSRHDDWYIYYCQMAQHLSSQGYTVFVSSHREVREFLSKHNEEPVAAIYPSMKIKNEWIKRLNDRYHNTTSEKDLRALRQAQSSFDSDVNRFEYECSYNVEYYKDFYTIEDINYDLYDVVKTLVERN